MALINFGTLKDSLKGIVDVENLDELIKTWVNLTLQDICLRVPTVLTMFNAETSDYIQIENVNSFSTAPGNNMYSIQLAVTNADQSIIKFSRMIWAYQTTLNDTNARHRRLEQISPIEMAHKWHNYQGNETTRGDAGWANSPTHYAIMKVVPVLGTSIFAYVRFYPHFSGTVTVGDTSYVHYFYWTDGDELSGDTDTSEILNRFRDVVLNGVLRWAFLFKGDAQRYVESKTRFELGMDRMSSSMHGRFGRSDYIRGQDVVFQDRIHPR